MCDNYGDSGLIALFLLFEPQNKAAYDCHE
jgi:hypothetical protein